MRMAGKSGIVTAGASGMGAAGARRFAKEGASVAVVDRDEAKTKSVVDQIRGEGGTAIALCGDLLEEGFSREIVRRTADAFGAIDFLWNHVGHPGPAAMEGLDLAEFDMAINLNLRTVMATTSEALPFLSERKGSVLFTSSTAGLVGSPFSPTYSIAKFGVIGLSRSLAKRYGPVGVRFNVICPGSIDTPMLRVFVARPDQEATKGADSEELVAKRAFSNPMGRLGQVEEIANAALFLLSDEASFVTGATLSVDGGSTA
jgi:NAD(P)-dependent dehydrogenase (short-subunit alcohol dehydrogenase family)